MKQLRRDKRVLLLKFMGYWGFVVLYFVLLCIVLLCFFGYVGVF